MKEANAVKEKSMEFAVRIVKLSRYLREEKDERVISNQVLRSGTSIGANIYEAGYGQSKNDFIAKISIALKEASETEYWLELLQRTEYLSKCEYESIRVDCMELVKILTAIVKSSKETQKPNC